MSEAQEKAAQLIAAKTIADAVQDLRDGMGAEFAELVGVGGRATAATAGGVKLGAVTVTDPAPVWRVTDPDALRWWALEACPEQVQRSATLTGDLLAEVVAALPQHLADAVQGLARSEVRAGFVAALCKAGGVHVPTGEQVPGITEQPGRPVVQVRPTDAAKAAAAELVVGGRLQLLPGGDR